MVIFECLVVIDLGDDDLVHVNVHVLHIKSMPTMIFICHSV